MVFPAFCLVLFFSCIDQMQRRWFWTAYCSWSAALESWTRGLMDLVLIGGLRSRGPLDGILHNRSHVQLQH